MAKFKAQTMHDKLRGLMHGVGHAGDRILVAHEQLVGMADWIEAGPKRDLFKSALQMIEMQANELKTTADE